MGNCWILKCRWPLQGSCDDAKSGRYEFDPITHLTIEPQREMEEVVPTKITMTDPEHLEIELGTRTSIENMNCTHIDNVTMGTKHQKEMLNKNIKLEMLNNNCDDDVDDDVFYDDTTETVEEIEAKDTIFSDIDIKPEDPNCIGGLTPLHDIDEEDPDEVSTVPRSLSRSSFDSIPSDDGDDDDEVTKDEDKYFF
jgi:hypothetical protein